MNAHYTYFLILACSVAGPLALSFDKKVGFYKKWKYLLQQIQVFVLKLILITIIVNDLLTYFKELCNFTPPCFSLL